MAEFNSNPNQRNIKINKEKTDDNNYYAKINLDALQNAMHSLTPKAFELWIYFAKNQDNYTFYLSKVDFLNWSNIKSTSYYQAFEELVQARYLIAIDVNNKEPKKYNFYETPQEEQEDKIEITINKKDFLF